MPRRLAQIALMAAIASIAAPAAAQKDADVSKEADSDAAQKKTKPASLDLPGEPVSAVPFANGTLSVRSIDGEKAVFFNEGEIARDLSAQLLRQFNVGGAPIAIYAMGANADSAAPCNGFFVIVWQDPSGTVRGGTPPFICGTDEPAVTSNALYFFSDRIAPGQVNPMVRWTAEGGFAIAADLAFAPVPGSGWDQLPDRGLSVRQLMENAAVYGQATAALGDQLFGVIQALENGRKVANPEHGVHVAQGCAPNQCDQIQALGVIDGVHQGTFFAARVNGEIARIWPELEQWPPRAKELFVQFKAGEDVVAAIPPLEDRDDKPENPTDTLQKSENSTPPTEERAGAEGNPKR
ncbi:hypothetical protein [Notoacmeibacter sp. MSK16QG-6]|uniref:hypothetical protein n=1 Tax=Notoacmeibacter sp. MSK16QG-6 TaxID=2957982 RepID=UPI00209C98C0|nr:hypothetical protein [Notoacmeibacter sp. MSK16QG-6]MCP1199132.1 hypothetical protein [Notoacmeibacter sp. MSK16QG-6]